MAVTVTYNTLLVGGDVDGDFQTNTYENGDQLLPDVLGLSGGGFVSAYNNISATDGLVALNFYDANHDLIGSHEFAAVGADTDAVGQPKLTELANGNVLVLWDDDNTTDSDAGPQMSVYTATGAVVAEDVDLIVPGTSVNYVELDVAALDDGGFVVSHAFAGNISHRIYDAAGVQQGDAVVVSAATGVQADTQVTVLSDGAFVVSWTDTNPAEDAVMARIFEANGTARTSAFVATQGAGIKTSSSVAALENGGFAVVSEDYGLPEGSPTSGIGLTLVSSTGTVGALIHVNAASNAYERNPDVTVLSNGFIAVTWNKGVGFGNGEGQIMCRVFRETGQPATAEFMLADGAADEIDSTVSALLGGMFVTSWQDATTDSDGGSISSQITELTRTVVGDNSADTYAGDELRDSLSGGGGNDTLHGGDANDTLDGGAGIDLLNGDNGHDTVQGGDNPDTLFGGAGNDRLYAATAAAPFGSSSGDLMHGDGGTDRIQGSAGADSIYGGLGNDKLNGGGGDDQILGEAGDNKTKGQGGNDTLEGGSGADKLNGGVGDDVITASAVGDTLNGANGHDTLTGSTGNDTILGYAGKDVIDGEAGNDTLTGGSLRDRMTGGLGADVITGDSDKDIFVFEAIQDSANGAEDLITDLVNKDVIDLSAIDARTGGAGNEAFTLVAAFTGNKAQLVVDYHTTGAYSGLTTVQGDVNGDAAADFTITIAGDMSGYVNFVL